MKWANVSIPFPQSLGTWNSLEHIWFEGVSRGHEPVQLSGPTGQETQDCQIKSI